MRWIFTLLVTAVVVTLEVLDNPRLFERGWQRTIEVAHRIAQEKDVRVEGLQVLSRTEVERVLPLNRSVFWWIFNQQVVQTRIQENPWIQSATVESCPGGALGAWGCFVVSLTERNPYFVATVDEVSWLIAEDGTFLIPESSARERRAAEGEQRKLDSTTLFRVDGLASRVSSPDRMAAQVAVAREVIREAHVRFRNKVNTISFGSKSDLAVAFDGLPFPIILNAGNDVSVSIGEQLARGSKLLQQFSDRSGEIEKIDLAFDRVGVVSFRDGVSGDKSNGK